MSTRVRLPSKVWSQLGEIDVVYAPSPPPQPDMNPDFGEWDAGRRTISINSTPCVASQVATLGHEMTHVALWDAGGQNVFTEQQIEFICDAVGTYLGGAVMAGFIKLVLWP